MCKHKIKWEKMPDPSLASKGVCTKCGAEFVTAKEQK